jgi:hypothetical protein
MEDGRTRTVFVAALIVGGLVCVAIGLGFYFSQTGVGGIESNPSFAQLTSTDLALIPIAIGVVLIVAGFALPGAQS